MTNLKTVEVNNLSNSSYGDNYNVTYIPQVSGNAVYGFLPSNFRTFIAGSGSAGITNKLFSCSTGETSLSYGTIQSFRTTNYKTGQGAGVRFGAIFPDSAALTWIGAGLFNIGDEVSFGYNGVNFGVWHRHGGVAEVQTLTITTPAGGSETASVTIDGTLYSIPITSGTVQHNAFEISEYLDANIVGWESEQLDDTVIIAALSDGDKVGTFSFSSTGAAAASWVENTQGVTKTSDFVAQADFNGTVPVGFDPSMGNNYQIFFKDGFGNIEYYIEHPDGTGFVLAHRLLWSNLNTEPNLNNPSLRTGCYAASIGGTTDVSVQVSDISSFIHGSLEPTRNPRAVDNSKSISTTETNILTLRNSRVYNGYVNQIEIEPRILTLSNDSTKGAIFSIYANCDVGGETNFQAVGTNLVSELDVTGTTVSGGRFIASFSVARLSSLLVNMNDIKMVMPPTLRLTITGRVISGSGGDLGASLTYYESV